MHPLLRALPVLGTLMTATFVAGCGGDTQNPGEEQPKPSAFSLRFGATLGGKPVSCTSVVAGQGMGGKFSVGVSDLRFYVSNVQLADANGKVVPVTFDDNEFQLNDDAGAVALVDLTSNTDGSCASSSIAFAEGTARTNDRLTGTTIVEQVTSVSFDVGVPQGLMKSVIGSHSLENAPSPLNEMYWNWATGYRHFVFNFAAENDAQESGGGYVHLGSRNCGPDDGLALADREACEFVNTPSFSAAPFDLAKDTVVVDLDTFLQKLDFSAPIYDPKTFEVIGEGVGAECHSSPMQPDCSPIFGSFGLDITTGKATAKANAVFHTAR